MKKTIIVVRNVGGRGKTETLRALGNLIIADPAIAVIEQIPSDNSERRDFRLVVRMNERVVGIESQGDPGTRLEVRLIELINLDCEIIVCASRTRGETERAIENVARAQDFQIIWTSTYENRNRYQHVFLNGLKAQHLLDLIQQI